MQNLVKNSLELIFQTKATILGNIIKIHSKNIDSTAFIELNNIYKQRGVTTIDIKRSGTGLTIIVTVS